MSEIIDRIPRDWPVRPIRHPNPHGLGLVTCGTCHLTWDDGVVTSLTPAPSARCPFEPFHEDGLEDHEADPGPRTRTAEQVADHAGILQEDAQQLAGLIRHTSGGSTTDDLARVADLVERLAAQVEDLAAVVASTA